MLARGNYTVNDLLSNDESTNETSFMELGLIRNTLENAEKIQFPDKNTTYKIDGLKHQVAWATVQRGHSSCRRGKYQLVTKAVLVILNALRLDISIGVDQDYH